MGKLFQQFTDIFGIRQTRTKNVTYIYRHILTLNLILTEYSEYQYSSEY